MKESTPLDNPAPEVIRLKAALQIDRDHYMAWLDANLNFVLMLGAAVEEDGEHPLPTIRAEYVFRHWNAR